MCLVGTTLCSETWPVTQLDVSRLERNVNSMVRWMCGVSLLDRISGCELRMHLGLCGVPEAMRWNRLMFFVHIQRQQLNTWPSKVLSVEVDAPQPRGRPKQRWYDVVSKDMKVLGIGKTLAEDRVSWRRKIHPGQTQQSQLQPSRRGRRRLNEE